MSPQSRSTTIGQTTLANRDDGWSSNACLGTTFSAEMTWAAPVNEYALHTIEFDRSGETLMNPPVVASEPRKRSSSRISSSSPKNLQPFLSSYGSAFLSGIFADIAQASDEDETPVSQDGVAPQDSVIQQTLKKARTTTAPTSPGRQPKSFTASSGVFTEGAVSEVSSPPFVSPRTNASTLKIELFNDSVRELQDMAFPSLPQMPNAISSSSCSQLVLEEVGDCKDEQEGPSFGWFVSTDGDEAEETEPFQFVFFSDTKPSNLAFRAITSALNGANHDLEVQQALAADTIDDVLGDLF